MASTLPYIGSKISLISNAEIRYEGILYTINTEESTIALQNVKSFGTEGRKSPNIPASNESYNFIIFRGKDIKDLTVLSAKGSEPYQDPAIITVNQRPTSKGKGGQRPPQQQSWWDTAVMGNQQAQWQPQWQQQQKGWQQNNKGNKGNKGAGKGNNKGDQKGGQGKGKGKGKGNYQQNYQNNYQSNYQSNYQGGDRRRNVRRSPVGELIPDENADKTVVGTDFDLSKATFDEKEEKPETVECGYTKSKSFFDTLSTDTTKKREPRDPEVFKAERETQRKVDTDTFGPAALKRPFGRRGGRGRGGRRF